MNTDKISKYISKKRKEKGLTQQELADMTHLSEKTISKWETGRGIPDIGNLQNLAKALDTSVIELLNGEESTKEEKVIDYIKYKDKKDKRILIYVILSALVIITLLITNQILTYRNFYKTNYDKTQVTKLYGSGELFDVNNMLVITSPEKTIMVTGKIEIKNNVEVPEESIKGYSINCEDKHIVSNGGPYISLMPTVVEELNGYNELFTEESLDNLDKWSITIYYKKDNKDLSEEIKLSPEQILTTDKYEREEIEPITRSEGQQEKPDYSDLKERLKKEGFIVCNESDECLYLETDKDKIVFDFPTGYIFYQYDKKNHPEYWMDWYGGITFKGKNGVIDFRYGRGEYRFDEKEFKCENDNEINCEKNGDKYIKILIEKVNSYY